MRDKEIYPKGNAMTFPLEFTQVGEEEEKIVDMKYLYPIEVSSLQEMVSNVCDQMEYDGSMMYDSYPDKVTLQRIASSICCHKEQCCNDKEKNPWMRPMVEIMLCNEMNCRREKRCRHKSRLS